MARRGKCWNSVGELAINTANYQNLTFFRILYSKHFANPKVFRTVQITFSSHLEV
jgi:hypothetical protein